MMALFYWLDQYTDTLQHFIASNIVLAPLLLLFLEEMGIPLPVPGDVILGYVGYAISNTHNSSIWLAFIVALIAVIGGSTILFFVSRRWGQVFIDKLGKFIFLKEKHIKKAESLFAKYGPLAIIFGRHVPGLRIPITVFAATSGVRYLTFIISTIISTTLWIVLYLNIGKHFGATFRDTFNHYLGLSIAVIVCIVLVVVGLHILGIYRERQRRK